MGSLSMISNNNNLNTNSPAREVGRRVDPKTLRIDEPFKSLFPIQESVLEMMSASMKKDGFKGSFPILVWRERQVVIDGHTRLQSALVAGLSEVIVYEQSFQSELEAIRYAKEAQIIRRNLNDGEILLLLPEYDGLINMGTSGRSSEKTAEALGTSRGKVEKARTVLKNADDELLEEVKSGEKSINQAYNEVQGQKQASQAIEKPLLEKEAKAIEPATINFNLTKDQPIDDQLYYEHEKSIGEIRISMNSGYGSVTLVAINSKVFEEEALKELVVTTISYLQWQIKRGGL